MAIDEIDERLRGFKDSGLIADYEVIVVDDSVRVRLVAPAGKDSSKLKPFIVETLAGLLSESQVRVEDPE